jgi:hypothetical protein
VEELPPEVFPELLFDPEFEPEVFGLKIGGCTIVEPLSEEVLLPDAPEVVELPFVLLVEPVPEEELLPDELPTLFPSDHPELVPVPLVEFPLLLPFPFDEVFGCVVVGGISGSIEFSLSINPSTSSDICSDFFSRAGST